MKPFAHLHLHTEYSLLDGAARIDKLFERCRALNMPAVAITDHGNMFGVVEFYKKAVEFTNKKNKSNTYDLFEIYEAGIKYDVKPIFGCEVYVCPDHTIKVSDGGKQPKLNHLVLLAKNQTGYQNLVKLVSTAYTQGFYYKPRADFELIKKYSKGLICLSACLAGEIPQALLSGDYEGAKKIALKYKAVFGDDFYIELQDHSILKQKQILPDLIRLSKETGINPVATNDVHYLDKDDSELQKVVQCISYRTTIDEERKGADEDEGAFATPDYYLKNGDEMSKLFAACPESVDNTLAIADKCDGLSFARNKLLPVYTPPDGLTPYEYLRKLTFDGLEKRYNDGKNAIERAEFELEIIDRLGFVDYFLIVWDFIDFAESKGITVGPGRGSGVGSIVAYATGITKVDPLKYDLLFERFLNSERVSSPDFDIDFCVDRRGEVIEYVIDKYGADKVAQIITFGTMAAKAAVKDVARVYNVPYADVDKVTKLMPFLGGASLAQILGLKPAKKEGEVAVIPDVKGIYETDDTMKRVFDMAIRIEGLPRQPGTHAAGVVICRDAISDHIPLAKSGEDITTQFDMIECEELGLLKMDFLGLRTLTDVTKTLDLIEMTRGLRIDFYNMEYDDKGVFDLIGEGDTHAVFQLESAGMKRFMRDLRPNSLEDVIAGIALFRPGPMDSIPAYVRNKKNPALIRYDDPILEPILKVTYGCIVYQEQVMSIVREMGGYTLGRADIVRRMMSKKKLSEMEREEKIFLHGTTEGGVKISGALARGVPEKAARKVFGEMTAFAEYAFNKSHAAAYAFLAYQTAYLKKYYTVEFITAVLNNRINSSRDIQNYLNYLKSRGIKVLQPDINKSLSAFSVEDGCVRAGLSALKSVGEAAICEIIAERDLNGEYKDFYSFLERMHGFKINKRQLMSLCFSGAFDTWGLKRSQLVEVLPMAVDRIAAAKKSRDMGQFDMFDQIDVSAEPIVYPDIKEFDTAEKFRLEREVTGVYLTGNPLEEYTDFLSNFDFNTSMIEMGEDGEDEERTVAVGEEKSVSMGGILAGAERRITKKGLEMGLGRLEDLYGSLELMVSPSRFGKIKNDWNKDTVVTVKGRLSYDDGVKMWVEEVKPYRVGAVNLGKRKIGIRLTQSEEVYEEVKGLIAAYPGEDEIYIWKGSWYRYPQGVSAGEAFMAELYGIVPSTSVEVK